MYIYCYTPQVLSELEHSGMSRNKEQSARMLDHFAVHAPRLLRPYLQPILKTLVPKLKEPDANPAVLVSILTCIGDLSQVWIKKKTPFTKTQCFYRLKFVVNDYFCPVVIRKFIPRWQVNGSEMKQWLEELLPILLETLNDVSSPEKRGVALWVLGQLVEATGYVIEPYNRYPALLDVLLNFLKTERQSLIR